LKNLNGRARMWDWGRIIRKDGSSEDITTKISKTLQFKRIAIEL